MRGLTSSLWPIHLKPLPDELLSSWLVRLAHDHGLKVQTLCNQVFGGHRQVWNRDIDRLGPDWLIDELIARTGTARELAYGTTLRSYEGWLYRKFRSAGAMPWILILKMYHRKRSGFGLQYCPRCLKADKTAYFRKRWRVAFYLICTKHHVRLLDRCPHCGSGVAFHRIELGRPNVFQVESLAICHACGFDLRQAMADRITPKGDEAIEWLFELCKALETSAPAIPTIASEGHLAVLHQLCKLLCSPRKLVRLSEFVADQQGLLKPQFIKDKTPYESRTLAERTDILMQALWLMVDLDKRLGDAWRLRAIRYNHMLKDFVHPPGWFVRLTDKFADWRQRVVG